MGLVFANNNVAQIFGILFFDMYSIFIFPVWFFLYNFIIITVLLSNHTQAVLFRRIFGWQQQQQSTCNFLTLILLCLSAAREVEHACTLYFFSFFLVTIQLFDYNIFSQAFFIY